MFRPAFSTIACPEWTLERVTRLAAETGYAGVELRTFGHGSSQIACDPALTGAEKVRRLFRDHGVEISCLATSVGFDEPIRPAVLGYALGDTEGTIRQAKAAIDLAAQIECPLVRVFGFEMPENERYQSAFQRIRDRLALAVDGARHCGVKVVLENGGSFARASDLMNLIEDVGQPLLGAAYSVPVAWSVGEDPVAGLATLGDRVLSVKLRDLDAKRRFCVPGEGQVPCERAVRELVRTGSRAWVTFEWDRLWMPSLESPERVLPEALRRMYAWAGGATSSRSSRTPARV